MMGFSTGGVFGVVFFYNLNIHLIWIFSSSSNFCFISSLTSQYELSSFWEFWIKLFNGKSKALFVIPSCLMLTLEGCVSFCSACPCWKFEEKAYTTQDQCSSVSHVHNLTLVHYFLRHLSIDVCSLILIFSTTEFWKVIWPFERPSFLTSLNLKEEIKLNNCSPNDKGQLGTFGYKRKMETFVTSQSMSCSVVEKKKNVTHMIARV